MHSQKVSFAKSEIREIIGVVDNDELIQEMIRDFIIYDKSLNLASKNP
jgi:hypothetical protein